MGEKEGEGTVEERRELRDRRTGSLNEEEMWGRKVRVEEGK